MSTKLEIDLSRGFSYPPPNWQFKLDYNDEIFHLSIDNHLIFYTKIHYITFNKNILTMSVLSCGNILNIDFILASKDERLSFYTKLQSLLFQKIT